MSCDQMQELLSARADGLAVDDVALDAHLDSCPACREFHALIYRIRRTLRLAPVGAAPANGPAVPLRPLAPARRAASSARS